MVKFRTFLKRSGALIGALLILVACALPSSAATTGDWGVPFSFDNIGLSGNVSTQFLGYAPFPLGLSGPSSTAIGGIDITSSFSDNSEGMVNIDFSMSHPSYRMRLLVDDVILSSADLFGGNTYLVFRFYEDSASASVSATVNYTLGYVYDGTKYTLRGYMSQISVSSANGADIAQLIADNLVSAGYTSSVLGDYVYLEQLDIIFEGSSTFNRFNMRQPLQSNGVSLFRKWFDAQDLKTSTVVVDPSDPSGVNLVEWLQVAIGGFLDFELWPGMSLNELLWVCLVVGILFTFFKMVV